MLSLWLNSGEYLKKGAEGVRRVLPANLSGKRTEQIVFILFARTSPESRFYRLFIFIKAAGAPSYRPRVIRRRKHEKLYRIFSSG